MTLSSFAQPASPIADPLARVLSLYEDGRCLDAWEAGKALGALHEWEGIRGRLMAGRLAAHLGAPRLGNLLHLRGYRTNPDHPEAQYYYVFTVLHRRGALAAWRERKRHGRPSGNDWYATAEYHGQCSQLLAMLRDFENAEEQLRLAYVPDGRRPYWYTERAGLYETQDRLEDALAASREGLAINPKYPPSILGTAHALQSLGRPDEALDLLAGAAAESQSSSVHSALIRLLIRLRRYDDLPEAMASYETLTPLRERELEDWLESTRADLATRQGDYTRAMRHVERVKHPFYSDIAANLRAFLEDPERREPQRVELPVPFVRQHYLTCAPATLTAISRFWSRPAEHLAVAEEICYDGTPDYSERAWARTNGWTPVEFRVDWTSARALIDRGVPFTLTLSDVASGHLQAVIGYDEPTHVLLVRDSMVHDTIELNARAFLAQQASTGPRGMAMVPVEQAHLLEGLELPESELYDVYHALQLALQAHDRAEAVAQYERLLAMAPGHRLTLTARRAIAAYDGNPHEGLAAIDALLALYPSDQRLQLARVGILRDTASRDDRIAWLDSVCAAPGTDALVWLELATELMADERQMPAAHWLVRRALRRRPDDAAAIERLAAIEWQRGARAEATELYRFAACLASTREDLAQAYFSACRWVQRPEDGLAFLRRRWEAAAGRSPGPTMTIAGALESLDRLEEAFNVLERGVAQRPDDGTLRLYASSCHARVGRTAEARAHFEAARGRVKHSAWRAEAARQARLAGDRALALDHWREIIALEPLNMEAHGAIALLLSESASRDDAVGHLREACERFPQHAGLRLLGYQWTEGDPASEREPWLRRLLEIDPANAWAQRELALNLVQQSRLDESLDAADEALALDTGNPTGHAVRAHVLRAMGRHAEAADGFRATLARFADSPDAIHGLLDTCGESLADRVAALSFVREHLEEQAMFGDGVLAFRAAARGVLTPEELLSAVRRVHERRPELWHAWAALIHHLTEMGRTDEALALARDATTRFPLNARAWFVLAEVHRARLESGDELAAIVRCRALDGDWIDAIVMGADALERAGRITDAEGVLESAIVRSPLVPELRVALARTLYRRRDHLRAIETVREALRITPDSDDAWQALAEWSTERGNADGALEFARTYAEARPREPRGWLRFADLALRATRFEEALDAADRVIAINPRNIIAHDLRALALTYLRRFFEAAESCDPPALRSRPSMVLQGRRAWIDMKRGDATAAIAQMRKLVERHPDYSWGWVQLVEWYAQQGGHDDAVTAARRWAWLEPSNVVPLGWLGDVLARLGDKTGSKEMFERAMRLEPNYLFAGFGFFSRQREEGDLAGAARTLEILSSYAPPGEILASTVELAVARDDRDTALAVVRQMCLEPAHDASALERAVSAITPGTWKDALEATLREAIAEPTWHPATPLLWAIVRSRSGRLAPLRGYRWLAGLGESGRSAVNHLLGELGERARRNAGRDLLLDLRITLHLVVIRWWCRKWRDDDLYWGKVGFVLAARGRSRAVGRWMKDWRGRRDVQPWMLQNLALALFTVGRAARARDVLRHVAREFAHTNIGGVLRLWCAAGALLDRDFPTADRLLHETPSESVERSDRPVRELLGVVANVLRGPRSRAAFDIREQGLAAEAQQAVKGEPAMWRLLALVRMQAGRHVRNPWVIVEAWWDLHPIATAIVSIAATIAALQLLFG